MEKEILKTGLSKEYKESIEGRDPIRELKEDINIYQFIISSLENKINNIFKNKEKLELKDEIWQVIEGIQNYLNKIRKDLADVSDWGELFATFEDREGKEHSIKPLKLKRVKEDLRKLFNLLSGLDNIDVRVTRPFEEEKRFIQALQGGKEQFYDRYFSERIAEKEKSLEELIGAKTALFNSGMAAIETVLREEDLKEGEVILVGENFYSQTKEILADYEKKGIKVIRVDTGKTEEAIKLLKKV